MASPGNPPRKAPRRFRNEEVGPRHRGRSRHCARRRRGRRREASGTAASAQGHRRPRVRRRQHCGREHGRRLRPSCRRIAHPDARLPVRRRAVPAAGTATRRRDPSSSAPTAATCSRSTQAATRSRCCGSSPTARSQPAEGSPVASGGRQPGEHRRQPEPRVRCQPGPGMIPGDTNYTGFMLDAGGHLSADPRVDLRAAERRRAGPGALQRGRNAGSSAPGSEPRRSTASPSARAVC